MIETLRIRDFAVVESADLEFGPGLNVLTGETGAGKSIVLGSLALLAGGRASAQAVRSGSQRAEVEALFRTDGLPDLEAELARRGFDADDHELVVRRSVAAGRGRAQLCGQLVPVALLSELFAGRLEISSQHDSQALRRPEIHGFWLDRMGGLLDQRASVSDQYAALRAVDEELQRLRDEARDRARRLDFLAYQVQEIDAAELEGARFDALRAERGRLAHAERLREEGAAAVSLLAGDPTVPDSAGAADRLAEAARRLEALAEIDPALGALGARVGGLASEVRDAALDIERGAGSAETDPARLEVVEERLHAVERLLRKYGASVEEVLGFREAAAEELATLEGADEREEEITRERAERVQRLSKAARALSDGRQKAGRGLATSVEKWLRELAMPQAHFEVSLEPVRPPEGLPCGATGNEAPEFRFAAGGGEPLRPLRSVASGGELSRAFLALRQAVREADAGMVLVFDEVDAGVGGRAADRVGKVLADLATRHQVLCITHLPQIAAFAEVHFRVEKGETAGRTHASITRVEGRERVEEIARMAGGELVGASTRRHARDLLAARAPSSPRVR